MDSNLKVDIVSHLSLPQESQCFQQALQSQEVLPGSITNDLQQLELSQSQLNQTQEVKIQTFNDLQALQRQTQELFIRLATENLIQIQKEYEYFLQQKKELDDRDQIYLQMLKEKIGKTEEQLLIYVDEVMSMQN